MTHIEYIYEKYNNLFVKPCFRKSRVDNTFLIVMNDNLETFYLTETAKEMMLIISNGIMVNRLYEIFHTEYEVEPTLLKNDIIDFLKDMQWKGLISLTYLKN